MHFLFQRAGFKMSCLLYLSVVLPVSLVRGFSLFELPGDGLNFGRSVSIYGHTAVVGSGDSSSGNATIFRLNETSNNGTWYASQKVTGGKHFGSVVSLHDKTLLVAPSVQEWDEKAYPIVIYEYHDTSDEWVQLFTFNSTVTNALIGDKYVVVTDTEKPGTASGRATIYRYAKQGNNDTVGASFSLEQVATLPESYDNFPAYARFGFDIDMWNDKYLIFSAPGSDSEGYVSGQVYIYEAVENVETESVEFVQTARLLPAGFAPVDQYPDFIESFGDGVAIFDNYAAVGSQSDRNTAWSICFYQRDASTGDWNETQRYVGAVVDYLSGFSMSMYNNYLIVGDARRDDVFIFHRSQLTQNWTLVADLSNADEITGGNNFGYSVGIYGDYAVIGDVGTEDRAFIVSSFKPDYISDAPTTFPTNLPSYMPTEPSLDPTSLPTDLTAGPTLLPTDAPSDLVVSTTLPGGGGAESSGEEVTKCSNRSSDDSKDAGIGVLVTLLCILLVTNFATVKYFTAKLKQVQGEQVDVHVHGEKSGKQDKQNVELATVAVTRGEDKNSKKDELLDNNDELYLDHQVTTQGHQHVVTRGADSQSDLENLAAMGYIGRDDDTDGADGADGEGSRGRGNSEGQGVVTGA